MLDNNDPIQEKKVFRVGLDDLTGNNDVNANEYSDLHNCSNDLSDRGSRLEELAHARYAENKRKTAYSTYNTVNHTTRTINKSSKWIVYIILFLFIGIPIIEAAVGLIIAVVSESINNLDNYPNDS